MSFITEKKKGLFNPFPGLRPFEINEHHLFFGRDGQSENVLDLLLKNRFAAVIGSSGSGKSSLLNCGVIPQLYGGALYDAGSKWKIIKFTPGVHPVQNLAKAIAVSFAEDQDDKEKIFTETNINTAFLTKGTASLIELIGKHENYNKENILFFIDQFEELFRFPSDVKSLEIKEGEIFLFINLFINTLSQSDFPIYLTLSIRSDFIGECSNYQALTDYINKSHYLVPQMTRDGFKSAITGPLALVKIQIEEDVLQEILNNLVEKTDQLPVLQHLMMRTWNFWWSRNKLDDPIRMMHYRSVGGLKNAISLHGDEVYFKLDQNEKKICRRLFQTITESGADNKGIRRPTTIENIADIIKTDVSDVIKIASYFREAGNSFLTPNVSVKLKNDTVLDISHESVMRNWGRLKGWIEEEADAVQMYLRLIEASGLYQSGKTGLWRPPELLLAIDWRKNIEPNDVWARRYHPAFQRSVKFLELSELTYNKELAEKERAQRNEIRRTRLFAGILGLAAIISISMMIFAMGQKRIAENAREEAEEQRRIAEMNALEADKQKILALQYAEELERQNVIVEGKWKEAEGEKEVAVRTADAAIRKSSLTEISLEEVTRDKTMLEQNTREALAQKQQAEQERMEAFRESMILKAQSLSSRSKEIIDDYELKALLAYQAYLLNRNNRGPENQTDIYSGLKEALISLNVNYQIPLKGHTKPVRSLEFSRQNSILYTAGSDGKLYAWNQFTANASPTLIAENNSINRIVKVSINGRWLVCACEGLGIQVFDLSAGDNKPKLYNAHENRVRSIVILNDNQHMLTSGLDNTILKWNLSTGEMEAFYEPESPAQAMSVSADDQYLAAGTKDGNLLVYTLNSNSEPDVLYSQPDNQILSVRFMDQGNFLISGDQRGEIRIWYLESGNLVFRKKLHMARITDIAVDPSGDHIATASTDGKVYVLDTRNLNQLPLEIASLDDFIFSVKFINNGRTIVTGSNSSNTLIAFPIRTDDLAKFICPNITRDMTSSEWNTYIGQDIPYEKTCDK